MGANQSRPEQGGEATSQNQQQQQQQQKPQQQEPSSPESEAPPKAEPETVPNQQETYNEPQLVANDYPKLVRRRSKAGNLMTAIEDIQRLPTEVIYQEFDRLLNHAQGQIKEVSEMPCMNLANRLKDCLYHNRQRSCQCFSAMEQYRQCVIRATQDRVDEMAAREPAVMIPVVPPQPLPPPVKPPQRSQRSWWRPWTWFK